MGKKKYFSKIKFSDAKKPPSSDPPSCTLIDQMKAALLELFTPQGGDIQHGALRLGNYVFTF
jgi:hypothetical protein